MLKHLKLENVGPSSAMELEFLFEDLFLQIAGLNFILLKLNSATSILACLVTSMGMKMLMVSLRRSVNLMRQPCTTNKADFCERRGG